MSKSLSPGARVGAYEIVATLGRGGMGEVYRARDSRLGREVALKVLSTDLAGDPDRLRRFEQEARAASALNHPNIVHIYDVGEGDGAHFIAMELVEGKTLRQILSEGPIEGERLLELSRQLADGLAKAHVAGIVHRDLKPENVMVTADGFVKILDFGLAKLTTLPLALSSDAATIARTRQGVLIGTVEYMSPEQAAGKSADYRSDQFSLGLILYEMATGKLAFHRDTAAQTLASIIENEPPPMASLNARPPEGLEAVVDRCLEKDPARRYPDTRELAKELKALPSAPEPARRGTLPPIRPLANDAPVEGSLIRGRSDFRIGRVRELGGAIYDLGDTYHINGGNRVRALSEWRLRKRIRQSRYSGVEMVRRDGDEEWVPLHETRIFKEEVPLAHEESSLAVAQRRRAMRLVQHAAIFLTFGVAMYLATGNVPFWMGFWAVGLVAQAARSLPSLVWLFRSPRIAGGETKPLEAGHAGAGAGAGESASEDLLEASFREEVARVRGLLERRAGESETKQAMLEEIERIVTRMRDLASKRRDLEEQTSSEEREELSRIEKEAQARAEQSSSARDRNLYQKQVDVVRQRLATMNKALAVLERLRVRQDVAEHQLKQLRLDLSRSEASSANFPELSSRLEDIRHEVDATDEVDEALARELTS